MKPTHQATDQPPLFSVVIPTYNRPLRLGVCLQSIANLNYPRKRFEVIVVDDGSLEKLDDVCQPFKDEIQLTLIRKTNAGPASARNSGALQARGKYLAFTDDDCELHPEWLSRIETLLTKHPDCMIGGRTVNRLDTNIYSQTSQLIVDVVYRHYNKDATHARFIASNNMAMSKEQFDRIEGFDLTFFSAASEDRELCSRWIANGFQIIWGNEAVVYHSHELSLGSFCKQHFTYGRGAYCFRKNLKTKKLGRFYEEIGFHLNVENWLIYPFRRKQQSAWSLAMLLMLWQASNASGFIWQPISELLTKKQTAT